MEVLRQMGHVTSPLQNISFGDKYIHYVMVEQEINLKYSVRLTFRHSRQTVWEHGRNFGFRISMSNSKKQMPQVTISLNSFSSLEALAIFRLPVLFNCSILLCAYLHFTRRLQTEVSNYTARELCFEPPVKRQIHPCLFLVLSVP